LTAVIPRLLFLYLIAREKSIMKFNKEWHLSHPMPRNATFEQRAAWHLEHRKNCSCRPIPAKLAKEMKKSGISI
jgi:hypothetical protein